MRKNIIDVRPLHQRENKLDLDARKGMLKRKCEGYFDLTVYKEQLLFSGELVKRSPFSDKTL